MKQRSAPRLAWLIWIFTILLLVAAEGLVIAGDPPADQVFFAIFLPVFLLAFSTVGALIAARHARNPIGWIFLGVGLLWALASAGNSLAEYAAAGGLAVSATVRVADWLGAWVFIPGIHLPVTFLFLLFPDGHLPSRRWLPVSLVSAVGIAALTAAGALSPGPLEDAVVLGSNPFAVGGRELWDAVEGFSWALGLAGLIGSVAALVVRFRRSSGDERQQMRVLAYASVLVAALFVVAAVGWGVGVEDVLLQGLILLALFLVPIAAGIAILRYRLYDIDVVISKTVAFGALAAFVTAVYVGVVVGIGALIGSRGNVFLSVFATAVIAVTFQPVRDRARHLANRLVYGKRATPYEVLAGFSDRMAASYSAEDVLPRMARILAEGTGAAWARVWLRVSDELRPEAAWPASETMPAPLPLAGDGLPSIEGADRTYPVRHHGELLGVMELAKPPGEPLTPAEDKLLADMASQAGLVLRNVRLIEELRASRQRLVAAQDEERRRLERNLHDGAQQQLVALAVKVRLAQGMAGRDPDRTEELLAQVQAEAQDALDTLRDLARGIYPPLLADQGLVAALTAQARRSAIPVEVEGDSMGRYPREAEAAVYFCVLEALQNVAKYARASTARVRLSAADGGLRFSVEDDGVGFDPERTRPGAGLTNMADRMEALGGSIEVSSRPGAGTRVTGRIPTAALVASAGTPSIGEGG